MSKHHRILCWISVIVFFVASPLAIAADCSLDLLKGLLTIQLDKLDVDVEENVFPEYPTSTNFKGYYDGNSLKFFSIETSTIQMRIEIKYWLLSKANYLAEYKEFYYAPYPDRTIVGKSGNYFFVCDGRTIKSEKIKNISSLQYSELPINSTLRMYKKIIKKKQFKKKKK